MRSLRFISLGLAIGSLLAWLGCNEIQSPTEPQVSNPPTSSESSSSIESNKATDPSEPIAAPRTPPMPPRVDPSDFVRKIDNRYFPLVPGTTFIYTGTNDDGEPIRDVFEVTHNTKTIAGVRTIEVRDRAWEDGILTEDTRDFFAQDKDGNVWYFGEDTKELDENGHVVSTEGTWRAGRDGARAGLIMLAHPQKDDSYRQEVAPDVAEDMAQVINTNQSVTVPYRSFNGNVLATQEWSPLDEGVVEQKYYARGVGFVYSKTVEGGTEVLRLVEVRRPSSGNGGGNGDDDDDDDDDRDDGDDGGDD